MSLSYACRNPFNPSSRQVPDSMNIQIRCSGEWKRCQRCVAMGLECVYPKHRGRNKSQDEIRIRRAVSDECNSWLRGQLANKHSSFEQAMQRDANISSRTIHDASGPHSRDGQVESDDELTLDDLHGMSFDASCIDESLFAPWIMNNSVQHSLDGVLVSSGSSTAACKFSILHLSQASF